MVAAVDNPRNNRDEAALRRHYEVERELSDRLRQAAPQERKALYGPIYNELFQRVPDHPQLSRKEDPLRHQARTEEQLRLLRPFLWPDAVFLEVGAGDCHLPMAVAAQVLHVYGVDISDVISDTVRRPANFTLVISDGTSIPVASESVHVAYSNMLLEHLHPDDAVEHLREVYRVLAPGGVYVCRTPHRFSGPQDISQYFDEVATGFHLKEYTFRELRDLFRGTGFPSTTLRVSLKGRSFKLAGIVAAAMERFMGVLPGKLRKSLVRTRILGPLYRCVTILGHKAPCQGGDTHRTGTLSQ